MPTPLFLLLLLTATFTTTLSTSHHHSLNDVCRLTAHHSLCIRTLSSFSPSSARRTTQWWARAAVSATLSETEHVYRYLKSIKSRSVIKGQRLKAALSDCAECLGDAMTQLRQTVEELRRPLQRGSAFAGQMSDVETWVSAVLTNQDTCQEELSEWRSLQIGGVREEVMNCTYFTSNALDLIDKLAAEGGSH